MSVLLKGLKMPKGNNFVTIHVSGDGKWCGVLETELEGEAVEVPTPHGELIDREVIRDNLMYEMVGTGYQSKAMKVCDELYTPTVIEAEE